MIKRAALVLAAFSAASALALAGCGGGAGSPASSSAPPATSSAPSSSSSSSSAAALMLMTSTVGGKTIVVDGKGNTVYMYMRDNKGETQSACTGGCASLWPAVTSDGTPTLQGVTGTIGSITTTSGKQQVTINGLPIYYYSKDTAPGQANGQGTAGVWYVVGADGSTIQGSLTSSTSATTPNTSGY